MLMDPNTDTHLTPLQICKFLCGVAWADAEITVEEQRYITNLSQLLGLREDQYEQVQRWFQVPPDPHDIAPSRLTPRDRQNLIQQALILVSEDGNFCSDEERLITVLARSLQIPDDELEDLHQRVSQLFKALPTPQAEELSTRMLVALSEDEIEAIPDPEPPTPGSLPPAPSLSGFSWDDALASRDSDDLLAAIPDDDAAEGDSEDDQAEDSATSHDDAAAEDHNTEGDDLSDEAGEPEAGEPEVSEPEAGEPEAGDDTPQANDGEQEEPEGDDDAPSEEEESADAASDAEKDQEDADEDDSDDPR